MVKHPRKKQNQSTATAITTDDTVTDDHSNIPVSTQSTDTNPEINLLKQLEDQNMLIKRLENRVNTLEGRIVELEINIAVNTTVNNNLRVMVDNQEQYLHRLCMVIAGIATPDKDISNGDDLEAIVKVIQNETGIQKDTIQENIDKIHHTGKPKQGKQQQIIKFKTDSFKEVVTVNTKIE